MNVTQFVTAVQDVLDDAGSKYPVASIVRHGDQQMRGLFRTLVTANKQYSNFTMHLQQSEGRQILQNVWEYRLPTWVTAVVAVHRRPIIVDAGEITFSPYRWTVTTPPMLQNEIPKSTHDIRPRWTWEGMHTLRIWNESTAPELTLQVAKLPARMFKARLTTASADTTSVYLPTQLEYGEFETEEGAYINSEVMVSSTADGASTNYGLVRRCVYSDPTNIVSLSRLHTLYFDAALDSTFAAEDRIETLIPLPDEHVRYLVLKTAQACFQKKASMEGLKAIAGELQEEGAKFLTYATPPRDTRGPTFYRRRTTTVTPIDPNHRRNWAIP